MTTQIDKDRPIPDTMVFDGHRSRQGYRLNKFSMSLADAANREAFKADEEGFMARSDLSDAEKDLIRQRDYRGMIEAGGNIYMIIKIGAVVGQGLYQIGAQQRGETYEEFLATRNASGAR